MATRSEFVVEITRGLDGPVIHRCWPLVACNEREALELHLEGAADYAMIPYITNDAAGHPFVWRGANRVARAVRRAN